MPANYDREFSLWLTQHGQATSARVTVLEFSHPAIESEYVCDFGDVFDAKDESGVAFSAVPVGFTMTEAAANISTEQRAVITIDNVNGLVMSMIRSLTLFDLQDPVTVVVRTYLDTERDAPAIDPLTLYLTNVKATRLAVELEVSADTLPNVMAGLRYTIDRFPTLAYL